MLHPLGAGLFRHTYKQMSLVLLKSVFHNIGVVFVGFVFAFLGTRLDLLFGIARFHSLWIVLAGWLFMAIGFLIRMWATFYFYQQRMKIISLVPQKELVTSGPYRFSRNPLYLGGNLFIFLGAVLILGSPMGILLTAINIVVADIMIRREEKQLALAFGEDWLRYKRQVRRWL